MREWDKKLPETGFKTAGMGRSKGTAISKLAFADGIAVLVKSKEEARTLHEMAEQAGLQISYEKTGCMSTVPNNKGREILTKYGRIRKVNKFRYLGDIISNIRSEQELVGYRVEN